MTTKKREIKYESLCMNVEIHIWTSFNRNKKNTGYSTIHLFNVYFWACYVPDVEVAAGNTADTIPSLIESYSAWSIV